MVFAHLSFHSYRFKKEKKSVLCLTHNIVVSAQKIVDFVKGQLFLEGETSRTTAPRV